MTDEEAIKQLSLIIASQGRIFETQSGASCRAIFHAINVMNTRKQGEWIDTGSGQECNVCHEIQYGYDNFRHFCANCGAKMQKGGAV